MAESIDKLIAAIRRIARPVEVIPTQAEIDLLNALVDEMAKTPIHASSIHAGPLGIHAGSISANMTETVRTAFASINEFAARVELHADGCILAHPIGQRAVPVDALAKLKRMGADFLRSKDKA